MRTQTPSRLFALSVGALLCAWSCTGTVGFTDGGDAFMEVDCVDGADDDGDGWTDCLDQDCWGVLDCGGPPVELDCADGIDDDQDGAVDCQDTDCLSDPSCESPSLERNCDDGLDDDGDGLTDCLDSDCNDDAVCVGSCVIEDVLGCGSLVRRRLLDNNMTEEYPCSTRTTGTAADDDNVWQFTAPETGMVEISILNVSEDAYLDMFVLAGECSASACVGVAESGGVGEDEVLRLGVLADVTYYIVVEGRPRFGVDPPYDIQVACE